MQHSNFDVIIVGGGPAGLATALRLSQRDPLRAARTLVLEAAHYPRRKVCGGAITLHGAGQLAALGHDILAPSVSVRRVYFRFQQRTFTTDSPDVLQIVQREAFDAALADATRRRGLLVRSGERVVDLRLTDGAAEVETTGGRYRARVVVGADGANSLVRTKLGLRDPVGVARLLRVITPADPRSTCEFTEESATFDFSCMAAGIQGYYWDFPCLCDGRPSLNRGIFDSRVANRPRGDLKASFAAALRARGVALEEVRIEGHPVRWYNARAQLSRPHAVLVGDAAGVDALFAEGISYAMEYGDVAAAAIAEAFDTGDLSFADYRERVARHALGRMLRFKVALARSMYGVRRPGVWRVFWRLAEASPLWAQQAIGRALGVLPPGRAPAAAPTTSGN